jgi:hypothetical protein
MSSLRERLEGWGAFLDEVKKKQAAEIARLTAALETARDIIDKALSGKEDFDHPKRTDPSG